MAQINIKSYAIRIYQREISRPKDSFNTTPPKYGLRAVSRSYRSL